MHTGWCNVSNFCYNNLNLNIIFCYITPGQTVFLNLCLVTLSCPNSLQPHDCSPASSFVHGDSPGKNTRVGCHTILQEIFPTQGLNPRLLHWRKILYRANREAHFLVTCNLFITFHALFWRKDLTMITLPKPWLSHVFLILQ